jgi:Ca2+-binding RTX toxin-like protein
LVLSARSLAVARANPASLEPSVASGVALAAVIVGTDGPDTINGTSEPDDISAKAGNDTVRGMSGSDVIRGQAGADKLYGVNEDPAQVPDGGDDRILGLRLAGVEPDQPNQYQCNGEQVQQRDEGVSARLGGCVEIFVVEGDEL